MDVMYQEIPLEHAGRIESNFEIQQSDGVDSHATSSQNSTARKESSKAKTHRTCMASVRCLPQFASFTIRRIVGFKLVLLSIITTLIVYSIHEYALQKYSFILSLVTSTNESHLFVNGQWRKRVPDVPQGQKRAPGCIIFGVSKCGTRAMLEYLKLHPSVVAASTEIDFFNNNSLYFLGSSWYLQQMPYSREGQIAVEKSPDYFQNPVCALRISKFNRSIKLILLLREPVERLISQYMQLLDKNPQILQFEKWVINQDTGLVNINVPSVRVSAYAEHLETWLESFPREQILIVESRSLRLNPFMEMKRVERFLNLQPYFEPSDFYFNSTRGFYCLRYRSTGKAKCLGKSKGRQHIPVDHRVKQILRDYYEPYNARLNEMLGYKFEWS